MKTKLRVENGDSSFRFGSSVKFSHDWDGWSDIADLGPQHAPRPSKTFPDS